MAFDAEFLKSVVGKEGASVDDTINAIMAEHEADTRGLIQKRDQLLGSEKKLKEQLASYTEKESAYNTKISELEETLKKNSSEDNKKYYETQLAAKQKEFEEKFNTVNEQMNFYKNSHLKRLEDDAIAEGTKDLHFVDGLKDGFVQLVLAKNNFEAKDIDGTMVFLNKDNKKIQEVMREFALSNDGKAYIKNPTSGGGASGGVNVQAGGKTLSRQQFEGLDNKAKNEFFRSGGKLTD